MNGAEHYRTAEQLLADVHVTPGSNHKRANTLPAGYGVDFLIAEAQVHASLGLAAATALCQADQHGLPAPEEWTAWVRAAGAWQETTSADDPNRPGEAGGDRTVYLLHFSQPYRHARHYVGKPESSGFLRVGVRATG